MDLIESRSECVTYSKLNWANFVKGAAFLVIVPIDYLAYDLLQCEGMETATSQQT